MNWVAKSVWMIALLSTVAWGNNKDKDGDGFTPNEGDCDDRNSLAMPLDNDGDGSSTCDGDCNDNDPNTFPGAAQLESVTDCMTDVDDDGYGDIVGPPGGLAGTDCFDDDALLGPFDFSTETASLVVMVTRDDQDANTFPGAAENDSADACMTDNDGDGFGDGEPATGILPGSDCDDSDAALQPSRRRWRWIYGVCW